MRIDHRNGVRQNIAGLMMIRYDELHAERPGIIRLV